MNQTRIDWCDYTWNPVIGCRNNCPYCYARKINKRFKFIPDFNKPEWRQKVFEQRFPKEPSYIFIGSMSDIEHWETEWIMKVLFKVKQYPQHKFLFLTKNPLVYESFNFSDNCWLGITLINQKQNTALADLIFHTEFQERNKIFISIEPIQEKIELHVNSDWLIVGMETGNRKEKIWPEVNWIQSLRNQCKKYNIPFLMKDNLKPIWDGHLIQEFPK